MTDQAKAEEKIQRVKGWENDSCDGKVYQYKGGYDEHRSRVERLRQQHEAYLKSLPTDPDAALYEIAGCLEDPGGIGEAAYGARAALEIIHQLAAHDAFDDSGALKNALYWLTMKGLEGLEVSENGAHRALDIARQFSPGRNDYRA